MNTLYAHGCNELHISSTWRNNQDIGAYRQVTIKCGELEVHLMSDSRPVATNDLPSAWAGREVVSDQFWIRVLNGKKQAYFNTEELINDWNRYGGEIYGFNGDLGFYINMEGFDG